MSGLISTIKDESRFLAADLTKSLFDVLKGLAETVANLLHDPKKNHPPNPKKSKPVLITAGEFQEFRKLNFAINGLLDLLDKHTSDVAVSIAGVLEPIADSMSHLHCALTDRFEKWSGGAR